MRHAQLLSIALDDTLLSLSPLSLSLGLAELESLMAASTVHEIVDERRWLQLGLGGGDEALEDSDEENENDPNVVRTLPCGTLMMAPT